MFVAHLTLNPTCDLLTLDPYLGIPREVTEDTIIAGHNIPKGTSMSNGFIRNGYDYDGYWLIFRKNSFYFLSPFIVVLANIPSLHWNKEYFPRPNEYIPERWIPDESAFPLIQDFTFYPFSAGTRNCVGKNFAMMEMRLILATILTTYELEYIPWQREDYVQYITTALATESYVIKMKKRT